MRRGLDSVLAFGLRQRRPARMGVLLGLVAASTAVVVVDPFAEAVGITFTVNTVDDEFDADVGDGICDTGLGTPSTPDCTLRAAIQEAEAHTGHDTIEFDIAGPGPHRIQPVTGVSTTSGNGPGPDTAYQLITDPAGVTIDGYSQPGSSENTSAVGTNAQIQIELVGLGPGDIDGLDFRSPFNVVRGLALSGFKRHIRLFGPSAFSNEITGNFIGVDATPDAAEGATVRVESSSGVFIEAGAHANRIGRANAAPEIALRHRNLIAGLADKGVTMHDPETNDNLVQNNLFGTDPSGTVRIGNQGHGVDINIGARNNWVGGFGVGEGNVVSGNELSGIEISHNSLSGAQTSGNRVVNNLVGTNADGSAAPPELRNREYGINFEGNEDCVSTCPPDINGNAAIGNVVVGSSTNIIVWKGAHDNEIIGNTIGTLADGSPAASSLLTVEAVGIRVGAFDNRVVGNTIAGVHRGIHVRPNSPSAADDVFATYGNTFSRNSIFDIGLGLGIALYGPDGDNPGEFDQGPLEPHPQSNDGIALPVIASVSSDELLGSACTDCAVEVFVTPEPTCMTCFAEYGRGKTFVADGAADALGDIEIVFRTSVSDPYVVMPGSEVSIIVTDADGNTSEFSERVTAAAGTVPPPTPPTTTTTPPTTTTSLALPTTTIVPTTTTTVAPTTAPTSAPTTIPSAPGIDTSSRANDVATRCGFTERC